MADLPAHLVIDTNVLAHAGQPGSKYSEAAIEFVDALRKSDAVICIDDADESIINFEYRKWVRAGTVAYPVLQHLFTSGRVAYFSTKLPAAEHKIVLTLIPKNPHDRVFVRVAFGTDEKHFVSHDWDDFPAKIRKALKKQLGVTMFEATDAVTLI